MLPIALDPSALKIGLTGLGEGLTRRAALLAEAGIQPVALEPGSEALEGLHVLFIAGLPTAQAARLARLARGQGILVNVEDVPALCDFHVPAIIRRGDLMLTVSTGGRSPGLARLIREWIERRLGVEWSGRLNEVSAARDAWRRQGHPMAEVARRTRDFVDERSWLA
ncbi:MAG TPA: NAD(P)-dependent oxidoreductase [Rhizomicrobium sp.]|jgi:precorrin-2 dehydrogenase/sirohydrochlorin ferrochelatase